MTSRLAIDIALLPPQEVTNHIISLTSHLPDAPTRLNTRDCFPHITLAMGILTEDQLPLAAKALRELGADVAKMRINIHRTDTYKWDNSPVGPFSELVVDPNPELAKLHMDVMEAFRPILTYDHVNTRDFLSPPQVATQSIYWVEHYAEQHKSPDDYHAHVTLGEGTVDKLEQPIQYTGSRLVLCHLGTYCTCRKVLAKA